MNYLFFQNGWPQIQTGGEVPDNSIELSEEQYEEITGALREGKKIIETSDGYSILDKPIEDFWIDLRKRRNYLLFSTDWTQLQDSPQNKEEWSNYRQQLRDLPQNTENPINPIWPEPPQ